jgi:hypothetical protein
MGFSIPKPVYRNPPLSVRTVSANRNNLEEGGVGVVIQALQVLP